MDYFALLSMSVVFFWRKGGRSSLEQSALVYSDLTSLQGTWGKQIITQATKMEDVQNQLKVTLK